MNQVQFGQAIGRSLQSVRAYEKHPADVTPEIAETIKALAIQHGHGDLAALLSSDDGYVVRGVFPSREKIVSPAAKPRHQEFHEMLDEVLDAEDEDATPAVKSNLITFVKYVRSKQGKRQEKKKTG